jgi:hypothetical protein
MRGFGPFFLETDMQIEMDYEKLRSLYLEALDASTGYSFSILELIEQVQSMTYEDMLKAYEEMPGQFKFH